MSGDGELGRIGAKAPSRGRRWAVLGAVLTIALALGSRAVAPDSAVTKYGGDALYTVLLMTLVVAVAPRLGDGAAALVALALSWAVELLQLADWVGDLSARSTAARLVLGSTFNAPDLLWYVAGAAAGWCACRAGRRIGAARHNRVVRPAAPADGRHLGRG
ncbi:DUF2809 domain-containing protein [Streptomyces sp. NPDC049954]|uniref:ribosomal maturation YjgA family protein n=1 Tax=Streptomyces sp. NPDC049954 TaxID=3155779 RepID=UPI003449DE62